MSKRARAHMSPSRRAGKPAPAASLHAVPHLLTIALPPSSGKWSVLRRRQEPAHGHKDREGRLRDATSSEYSNNATHFDVTHADPQARVPMRAGSADRDGSAASTSEAPKRNHYARLGQVPSNQRSHKLVTKAVERFGPLGKEGNDFIDQLTASIVGRIDAWSQKICVWSTFFRSSSR